MTPLQRLLANRRAELNLSFSQAERLSGGRVKRQNFQRLETTAIRRSLDTKTIEGIALAYQLPQSVVKEAAAESLGLRMIEDPKSELRVLTARVEERLNPEQQQAWLRMAADLIDLIDRGTHT